MSVSRRYLSSLLGLALLLVAMLLMAPVKANAEDFKCKDDGNALHFDASNCPGTAIYEATKPIATAASTDESVFEVNIGYPYITYSENDRESDYCDLSEDGKCEIVPMGPGTATLILKDEEDNELTETITVDEEYFSAYLKSKTAFKGRGSVGMYYESILSGKTYTNDKIAYGDSNQQVFSRYGTKVTLKLKGKTYKGTTNHSHTCIFTKVKSLYKLGTTGNLTFEFGPAKITKTVKIGSDTYISPFPIKPNAKKGKAEFYSLHKGDVVTVKVGGKTVKTVKIKKFTYYKIISFTSKKKMKKNTKVQYIVKNKFKQTLKKKTYKVRTLH
ncbi:MAG: hypothetical protein IKX76_06770 [Eubacterium sp.]|nr:hypothetical protein [Eubacterium sp.]